MQLCFDLLKLKKQRELIAENHLHHSEQRWFAVYTKYKCEKLVNKQLQRKGIEVYLPLQKVVRRYTSRIKRLELPLISCYIFVKVSQQDYIQVLETNNVLEFVKIGRNLISIPEREIEILRRVVGEGNVLEIEPTRYQVGDRVEIISGGLTGMSGKLVTVHNKKRFVVELETIGYSLHMEVEPAILQRA